MTKYLWLAPASIVVLSLSMTAACGSSSDEDQLEPAGGASGGGSGGSGATAGSSGSGGSSASGGTAGGAGTSGSSGTAGAAGTGGTAGAGGTAGSGGGGNATDQNLRVALIGDSGAGSNFTSVLNLIKAEKADFVLHQGDFDYSLDPAKFFGVIDGVLGPTYPYFASVGNHDAGDWAGYVTYLKQRMTANGVTPDDSDLSDQKYSIQYRGLEMVFVGENGNNSEFATFLDNQLGADNHIWKVCSWHKNQQEMQIGGKGNSMGWDVYENCRKHGAIIATGHEHSYERTRTLTNMQSQTVDSTCSDAKSVCVGPGRTFAFVSGLGGTSIRDQERCLPTTFPYGCNGEWASIYTSNQNANYGALFIDFYVDGDPKKAHGYFKDIDNKVIDEFDIKKD